MLHIVTYNIRKGKGASGRRRQDVRELGQALGTQRADLVLCQEVFHSRDRRRSQSHELGETLGMRPYYHPNMHRRVGHHGNATFTSLPVELVENFDMSIGRVERRGALYTRMRHGGSSLHVFNVHLSLSHSRRLAQVRRLKRILDQVVAAGDPVILAGDFNDWRERLDTTILRDLGFTCAFGVRRRPTWHARRPLFNLDRVYLKNLRVRRANCLSGVPWRELSDHLPLSVELGA